MVVGNDNGINHGNILDLAWCIREALRPQKIVWPTMLL